MRITTSPIVTDASGSFGELTFSSRRGTAYVRTRVTPKDPATVKQVKQRNAFLNTELLWKTMHPFAQNLWLHLASGKMTGKTLFRQAMLQAYAKDGAAALWPLVPQSGISPVPQAPIHGSDHWFIWYVVEAPTGTPHGYTVSDMELAVTEHQDLGASPPVDGYHWFLSVGIPPNEIETHVTAGVSGPWASALYYTWENPANEIRNSAPLLVTRNI